ncbi:unnamed protein product [Protopolystoma xenopodis]|uniref:Uncharacterized protein n=1 Tax=Protopolystoma xenopodis TaxID=117903 RepID=A0A3S5A0D7_9PLAT|nr:unnamed protein product [Protopolystoma xenopodis]
MARLNEDDDYDAGKTSDNLPGPRSDVGTWDKVRILIQSELQFEFHLNWYNQHLQWVVFQNLAIFQHQQQQLLFSLQQELPLTAQTSTLLARPLHSFTLPNHVCLSSAETTTTTTTASPIAPTTSSVPSVSTFPSCIGTDTHALSSATLDPLLRVPATGPVRRQPVRQQQQAQPRRLVEADQSSDIDLQGAPDDCHLSSSHTRGGSPKPEGGSEADQTNETQPEKDDSAAGITLVRHKRRRRRNRPRSMIAPNQVGRRIRGYKLYEIRIKTSKRYSTLAYAVMYELAELDQLVLAYLSLSLKRIEGICKLGSLKAG